MTIKYEQLMHGAKRNIEENEQILRILFTKKKV